MSVCGVNARGNKEQAELIRLIQQNDIKIVYCVGNAGTGKTFISLATALQMIYDGKFGNKRGKIYYIREPIEVGKSLGFLPGDLNEKFDVYLDGIKDNLEQIEDIGGMINAREAMHHIECRPPNYLRGASKDNCVVIIDEAQNLSMLEIRTILTRCGEHTKCILLGSTNQIDNRTMTKEDNDFIKSYEKLKEFPFVGFVELFKSERSSVCSLIDEALSE